MEERSSAEAVTRAATLAGVACSSGAVLILEVVLTRVFAVAQFYHFAFLAVSLALLGFGRSDRLGAAPLFSTPHSMPCSRA